MTDELDAVVDEVTNATPKEAKPDGKEKPKKKESTRRERPKRKPTVIERQPEPKRIPAIGWFPSYFGDD
jgi:hypothetical protein